MKNLRKKGNCEGKLREICGSLKALWQTYDES